MSRRRTATCRLKESDPEFLTFQPVFFISNNLEQPLDPSPVDESMV